METIKERLESIDAYIILGVGGDSGSGKTTFSRGIRGMMGEDMVSGFSMDDYHMEDRETRKRTGNLPLDPKYNHLDLLAEHLIDLRKGKGIVKPVYNHTTGELDPAVVFEPSRITIIEGLHPFHTEELRRRMDLKIFVDPEREVKWKWKLERDVGKRGHDREDALDEMLRREPLFKMFIDVQKIYSDITVHIQPSRYSDDNMENPRVDLIMCDPDMPVRNIDINLDLAELIRGSKKFFSLEFGNDYYYGKRASMMKVDGSISRESLSSLEERICSFTGVGCGKIFDEDLEYINPTGISQIIVAWWFLEKLHIILTDLEKAP